MGRRKTGPNLDVEKKPKGTGHAGLDEVIARVEKKHGTGAVMQPGRKPLPKVNFIPSASLTFDLTIGGFARGMITELWGPEGCGKSSFMLQTIAAAQAAGLRALFTDAEQALNFPYAKQLGVQMEDLLICQPNSGEEALDTLEEMIGSGAIDLAVFDSVAAIVPQAELDGEIGDSIVGVVPRLMGQFVRKVVSSGILRKSNTALVFINQIREKIGILFGNPETQPGGRALKFTASLRVDMRRIAALKAGEKIIGARTRFKVPKSRVCAPYVDGEFDLIYGEGVNRAGEIVDLGVGLGVVEKSGSWYSHSGERLGAGRFKACAILRENTEWAERIEGEIREAWTKRAEGKTEEAAEAVGAEAEE